MAGLEPIGQQFQVGRAGPEAADVGRQLGWVVVRRRGLIGRHGDPMLGGMNVNAGRVRILHAQRLGRAGWHTQGLGSAGCHGGLQINGVRVNQSRPQAREGVKELQSPKRGHVRCCLKTR